MNIALPALLIILFILPGILSRYAYTRGIFNRWSNIVQVRPWTEEIVPSLALAILIQALWYSFVHFVEPYFNPVITIVRPDYSLLKPDFFSVFVLLTGSYGKNDQFFEEAVKSVTNHPYQVAFYLLGLIIFSLGFGGIFRRFVVKRRLGLEYEWVRFSNVWHYLLTGEVLNFEKEEWTWKTDWGRRDNRSPISGVFLAAFVEQGGTNFLYHGIVKDFWFDPRNGNLEGVQLMLASRRELSEDTPPEDSEDTSLGERRSPSKIPIRGDFFVLKYPETKNVNLLYLNLEKSPKGAGEVQMRTKKFRGKVSRDLEDVLRHPEGRKSLRNTLEELVDRHLRELPGEYIDETKGKKYTVKYAIKLKYGYSL